MVKKLLLAIDFLLTTYSFLSVYIIMEFKYYLFQSPSGFYVQLEAVMLLIGFVVLFICCAFDLKIKKNVFEYGFLLSEVLSFTFLILFYNFFKRLALSGFSLTFLFLGNSAFFFYIFNDFNLIVNSMGDDYYEDEAVECYFEIIGHFFFKFWIAFFKQTKSDLKSGK